MCVVWTSGPLRLSNSPATVDPQAALNGLDSFADVKQRSGFFKAAEKRAKSPEGAILHRRII